MEVRIIGLICARQENREIAAKLERSIGTVEGYRSAILVKTKMKNTAGVVIYAIKKGIFKIR